LIIALITFENYSVVLDHPLTQPAGEKTGLQRFRRLSAKMQRRNTIIPTALNWISNAEQSHSLHIDLHVGLGIRPNADA